jgi:hypothetical protein
MHNKKQRVRRFLTISMLGFVLAVVACMVIVPIAPEGQYSVKGIAGGGVSRLVFRGGQVLLTDSEAGVQNVGSYFRSGNKWLFVTDKGYTNRLEATWLWLKMTDSVGGSSKRYRRVLIE